MLLLFSDQVAAAASGDVVTTMLIETAPGTWYDATSDLVSGTVTRGRNNELDRYQAGTCEVVLSNDGRKYDPTYAASPLAGYVLPMKRVQLKNTYNGTTYPMFTGYADRWTQNRPGPHRGTTSLQATDGLKVLERARLATSVYALEVAMDSAAAMWRLDEPAGSAAVFDSIGSNHLGVLPGANVTLGQAGLVSRDAGTALKVNVDANGGFARTGTLVFNGPPFTIELVYKHTVGADGGLLAGEYVAGSFPGTFKQFQLFVIGTNVTMATAGPSGLTTFSSSGVDVTDGGTYHIVATLDQAHAAKIYINGVLRGSATEGGGAESWSWGSPFGTTSVGGNGSSSGSEGTYQFVTFYNTVLSTTRLAAHAAAVATPWNGDLPGARVTRVLDAAGWPAADRNIDTGQTTLQSAALDMTALEHLQKVADTEPGNLYVTAGGTVRFEDRNSGADQPVLFAFSDAAGAGLAITFSNPEMSDTDIRNDVTVSRLEGVAQTARDATSIATYLTSSYVRDGLYNNTDAHSRYMADFILQGYKDPAERVSQMAVNPYRDPANLWPAILGLELTDRVTLTETPQWVTPAVARTAVVEGISHTFSAKAWSAAFNLSQNTTATQAYWQLGVAGFSELEQTTRLFF